jgi:uncharacterized RDD family membrane protein YckC
MPADAAVTSEMAPVQPSAGEPPGYGEAAGQPPGYPTPPGQTQYGYTTPASQAYYGYPQTGYGKLPGYPGDSGRPAPGGRNPALAGPGSRLGARVIDWLLLGVVTAPLWAPVWSTFFSQLRTIAGQYPAGTNIAQVPGARSQILNAEGRFAGHMLLVMIAYCLISLAYDWIQHGLWGQTIGKRAVGIIVVSARDGSRIGTGAAGGRAAIYALPSIVPLIGWIFGLVNELWLLWDASRQCVHDHAAHTVVINKSYLAKPSGQAADW